MTREGAWKSKAGAVKGDSRPLKGYPLMSLYNSHIRVIFAGWTKKNYSDHSDEQLESTGSAQMASAQPINQGCWLPSKWVTNDNLSSTLVRWHCVGLRMHGAVAQTHKSAKREAWETPPSILGPEFKGRLFCYSVIYVKCWYSTSP